MQHKPNVLMVGSHHALQIGCAPVQNDLDLSSVVILAPMGSAVHAGLKDELKKHFPNMIDVSKPNLYFDEKNSNYTLLHRH
jgi:hypothetical protein